VLKEQNVQDRRTPEQRQRERPTENASASCKYLQPVENSLALIRNPISSENNRSGNNNNVIGANKFSRSNPAGLHPSGHSRQPGAISRAFHPNLSDGLKYHKGRNKLALSGLPRQVFQTVASKSAQSVRLSHTGTATSSDWPRTTARCSRTTTTSRNTAETRASPA